MILWVGFYYLSMEAADSYPGGSGSRLVPECGRPRVTVPGVRSNHETMNPECEAGSRQSMRQMGVDTALI